MYAKVFALSLVILCSFVSRAKKAVDLVCFCHVHSQRKLCCDLSLQRMYMLQVNATEAAEALEKLQQELYDVSRQRDTLAEQHKHTEKELKSLEEQVHVLTDERNRKIEEAGALKASLNTLTVAHDKLRGQIEKNVLENKELVSKLLAVEKMRMEHENKMEMLHSELQQVKEAKAQDVSGLQEQVSQIMEQNRTLEDRLQQSSQDAAALRQEKEASLAEAAQLRSSLNEFVCSHEELKGEMLKLEHELRMDVSNESSDESAASDQNRIVVKLEKRAALRAARPTDVHEKQAIAPAPQDKTSQNKGGFGGMFAGRSANTEAESHHNVDTDSETPTVTQSHAAPSRSAAPPPPLDSPYLQIISYKHTQEQVKVLVSALKAQVAGKDAELDGLRIELQRKQESNDAESAALKQKLQEAQEAHQDQVKMVRYVTMHLEESKMDAERNKIESIQQNIQLENNIMAARVMLDREGESKTMLEMELAKKSKEIDRLQADIAEQLVETTRLQRTVEAADKASEEQLSKTRELDDIVKQKTAEISSLQEAMDKARQETGEYATHLEGKVEASNATLAEARQSIQTLEEDVGRKEAELASLQAALDKTRHKAEQHVVRKEAEIASLQEALDKTKQEASEYATHLEGEVDASKASLAEVKQNMQALEEDVGRKEAEITSLQAALEKTRHKAEQHVVRKEATIASLQAALDKTKQEAGEYATHLEGEVEASKATLAEATQSIQALEEDVGRKESEIA
jgi:chromosome segregation ATPase